MALQSVRVNDVSALPFPIIDEILHHYYVGNLLCF